MNVPETTPEQAPKADSPLAWLDRWPWIPLLVMAALLGAAPFRPEPHLVEKLRMLSQGLLIRPLDIFDLFLHATPLLLVMLKLSRQLTRVSP